MNRCYVIALSITGLLLVLVNLMPTNKGVMLSCYGGGEHVYRPQETHGFPFTYVKANRTAVDCFTVDAETGRDLAIQNPTRYNHYFFSFLGFLGDILIAGAILGIQRWLIKIPTRGRK